MPRRHLPRAARQRARLTPAPGRLPHTNGRTRRAYGSDRPARCVPSMPKPGGGRARPGPGARAAGPRSPLARGPAPPAQPGVLFPELRRAYLPGWTQKVGAQGGDPTPRSAQGPPPAPGGGALCPGPQISAATTSSLNPSARTRPPTQGPAPPPRTHPGQTRRSGPGVLDPDPREPGARSIRYQFLQVWRPGFPYPPGTRAPGPPQPGVQTPLLLRTQTSCTPSPNPGVRGRSDHPGAWSSGRLSLRDPGVPRAPSPAGGVPHPQDPSLLTWLRGGFRARRGAGPAAQRGDPIGPGAGPAGAGCGSRLPAPGSRLSAPTAASQTWRRGDSAEGGAGPDRAPPTEAPPPGPAQRQPLWPFQGWGLPAMGVRPPPT